MGLTRTLCLCAFTTAVIFSISEAVPLMFEKVEDTSLVISIEAGSDAAHSSLKVTGSLEHVISDTERQTFHLSDYQLKQAVGKSFGRVPDDAYLHSPTPWNDLYKTYGWDEVKTVLVPTKSEVLGVSTQSLAIKTQVFENNSTITADYDVSISDDVQNSVTNSWNTGGAFTFTQKFTCDVGFLGTEGGGETDFSYQQSWGVGGSHTRGVTVGSSSGVMATLKPGQSVKAVLTATLAVMNARVWYEAYLEGSTAINYGNTYKGHHFWDLSIGSVMASAGISNSIQTTEDIEVGYFSNGKIILEDAVTSEILAVHHL